VERVERGRERGEPAWLLLLVGWMAGEAALDGPLAAPPPARPPRSPPALADASPRELRALPGIGETRALAIARERWRARSSGLGRAAPLDLEAVPGIGPKTVEAIEAWLRERSGAAEAGGAEEAPRIPPR
jgi:hypothetical protein